MESKELIRKHESYWASPRLIFWPLLATALAWVLRVVIGDGLHTMIPTIVTAISVACWLVAWIIARTHTYIVFEDTVFAQIKFISRTTSEARIAVVRSIGIHQSLYQRLFRIGNVVFKSAGDDEDVIFEGIHDPEGTKRLVQQQQNSLERKREESGVIDP
jgi:uncharacterized membrane protein YdbT with pleckstrin-like domain